jgi:hypothetical protein
MAMIMRLIGTASGEPTAYDGQWLVEYDPTRAGVHPGDGRPTIAHIVTTDDPHRARRFADAHELHACWTAASGLPAPRDRPLTAFTIAWEPPPEES